MKVLVLCHGSVNRSPFAAYLLRVLRPDLDVRVRALKPDGAGRRPTPKVFDAVTMSDLTPPEQVDLMAALQAHRSQVCTREDVLDSDLTLYMDNGNRRRLEALMRPGDTYKSACLADWEPDAITIRDPNFLSREKQGPELRAIFGMIERCVRRLAEELPR